MASSEKSKADLIEERRSNLPLPEDPPVASDWNSADASKVNVGSGGVQSDISYGKGSESGLRGPDAGSTTGGVDTKVGREGRDNLDSLPKDAKK
ncbi:MAG: hypothetical protein MMC23_005250 [Stictis urceolatum]|nr:hypothetical protein [Stictis urceolata]